MRTYQIKHHRTGAVLFGGKFRSLQHCLETAVQNRVSLHYADLRHARLLNAMLDDARLDHALFTHANLVGANLSEAQLTGADFGQAELQNACLCLAVMARARFIGAQFGGTGLAGAVLDRAQFSPDSAWHVNFQEAQSLHGCAFIYDDTVMAGFSQAPLVLTGLAYPVMITDHHLALGDYVVAAAEFQRNAPFLPALPADDPQLSAFLTQHQSLLQAAIAVHISTPFDLSSAA